MKKQLHEQQEIILAAIQWWKNKKPCDMAYRKFLLENPTCNSLTHEEKQLAKAVADYLQHMNCL